MRVPQIAGRSGGSAEAVVDGKTGLVVDDPGDPGALAVALRSLLVDEAARRGWGRPPGPGRWHHLATTTSPVGWPPPCRTWKAEPEGTPKET